MIHSAARCLFIPQAGLKELVPGMFHVDKLINILATLTFNSS